jgi:hypothetical protein
MNFKLTVLTYAVAVMICLALTWAMGQFTIKTMPPIKVEIVKGHC